MFFAKFSFFSGENKIFIYLFIYWFIDWLNDWLIDWFIYTLCLFFAKFDTCKIKGIWWLAKSKLVILKTFSTHKGIQMRNQIRLRHICTWHTLLMPCLTSITICKRRICNISRKLMIKVKRFSASTKSGAIIYKSCVNDPQCLCIKNRTFFWF